LAVFGHRPLHDFPLGELHVFSKAITEDCKRMKKVLPSTVVSAP